MEYVKDSYRVVTSPAAKRTYLGTFLFFAASLALLCVAALVYPVFYYNYVPQKVISVPLHLQYNAGLNPYGITSLSSNLMLETAYDVFVELVLPRSPANLERGNFMVAMFAMKSPSDNPAFTFSGADPYPSDPYEHVTVDNVVFSSRRPALIPYEDPLVSTASRIIFLLYHVLYPVSEKSTLTVPMGELVEFKNTLPLSILLDVQAGQTLQVYSTTITLVARLSGIRWFMYNYRIISFILGTSVFWGCEMLSTGTAWLLLAYVFSNGRATENAGSSVFRGNFQFRGTEVSNPTKRIDDDNNMTTSRRDSDVKDESDDDMKFKQEDTEDTLVHRPTRSAGGGDADDEYDDDEAVWKESTGNVGRRSTSYDDEKGGSSSSLRRRSSNSSR